MVVQGSMLHRSNIIFMLCYVCAYPEEDAGNKDVEDNPEEDNPEEDNPEEGNPEGGNPEVVAWNIEVEPGHMEQEVDNTLKLMNGHHFYVS